MSEPFVNRTWGCIFCHMSRLRKQSVLAIMLLNETQERLENHMKLIKIGDPEVIMSNPDSKHNYFAWPTIAKLQNGKLAVVASGYRMRHVCPFGKSVIAYSEDEGKTYTAPAPVIDTVLDDRDSGILAVGEDHVIVTSFNLTLDAQNARIPKEDTYSRAYHETLTRADEERYMGSLFRISSDQGITFGPIYKSPVSSPHGPIRLRDESVLWVGKTYTRDSEAGIGFNGIQAHKVHLDGTTEFVGQMERMEVDGVRPLMCEPHAIELSDGRILCHVRVEDVVNRKFDTVYQSVSNDQGHTWSSPVPVLPPKGGAPAHLLRHSSGVLISAYSYRQNPTGIHVMFSKDEGESWDMAHELYVNDVNWDLGYPSTVELSDGSLLTVFYAHPAEGEPAVILQQRWTFE